MKRLLGLLVRKISRSFYGTMFRLRSHRVGEFHGMPIMANRDVPSDEIQFRNAKGEVVGRIVNIGKQS